MNQKNVKQEGIIIMLLIVAVGSIILSTVEKNMILLFEGVAVLLLDTVLVLDYDKRRKLGILK